MLIYRGPSRIDGSPIVGLLTGVGRPSSNMKTGRMAQLYICPEGISPLASIDTGRNRSVCGNCKHMPGPDTLGSCYVNVGRDVQATWNSYARGGHAWVHPIAVNAILQDKRLGVRLGAWGEPGALPIETIDQLVYRVKHTGYTHMGDALEPAYYKLLMASVDTPAEMAAAQAAGRRTFRVRLASEPLTQNEITCPASAEAGHRTTCDRCALCSGASSLKSIVIQIHGNSGNAKRFIQIRSIQ